MDPSEHNEALAYYNLGLTSSKQGQLDEAILNYSRAIELDPQLVVAYIERGKLRSEQKKYELAIEDFDKAIILDRKNIEAYWNRGMAYIKNKEGFLAWGDFNKIIDLDPKLAKAYYYRGLVCADQMQIEEARADFEKAIELDPTNARYYTTRGSYYANPEEAIVYLNKAIELDPNFATAYNFRGSKYYLPNNNYDLALADFNKAIELSPGYPNAYANRGLIYDIMHPLEPGTKQLFIENMSAEQIANVEGRMRPGQFSGSGFLDHKQSLKEVIDSDTKELEKLGITHNQVADRLDSLTGQGFRQWELISRAGDDYYEAQRNGALIDDFLRVTSAGYRGDQFCPFYYAYWQEKRKPQLFSCGRGSHDFEVKNERSGTEIRFPELMAHLVRDHHFFEGNTRYRLSPRDAVQVLELETDVNYTPKTAIEITWLLGSRTNDVGSDFAGSQKFIKNAERALKIAPGVTAYLTGDTGWIVAEKEAHFKEPLRIDGDEVLLHQCTINRGQIEIRRRGKHEYILLTTKEYSELIKLSPKQAAFYYDRGIAYTMSNLLDLAIEDFTSVIKLDPENIKAYFQRGCSYENLGNKSKAIADFETCIKFAQNTALAEEAGKRINALKNSK